ncbi:uncharacterized protein LOC110839225 isoform X2 [Zootermopsis nevadensis]|uniref:uncharacterized protein LOC110839225 isoform X2 n=1 Tax=Zootermopsis nevadensis TaxID=136037 RepID=UPI000B8EBEF8|nr:uncharacterized protein LOC110839225 isoform X2 [Zootermopsis nevadensis]
MQDSHHRLTLSSVAFREHLQERNCMWLPVSLPIPSEPVPTDVALWLFELRHFSDCNDVSCNVKVNVDCDGEADYSKHELHGEEFQHFGLKKSDEEVIQNCDVALDYHNTAEVYVPKEDIPNLLTQKEEHCVKIHSKEEEIQNYSDGQERHGDFVPELLIQKDEGTWKCNNEFTENSNSKEEITGLLISKEEVCIENYKKVEEEALICCCECPNNFTPREDNPRLHQKEESNVHSHKCDCDDVLGSKIYSCVAQGNGLVVTDESSTQGDIQAINQYQVGELPIRNQALACDSILWEKNPLYCRVGVGRNERGFRKLCHSTLDQLDDSIHVGPGEEFGLSSSQIDEPVFADVTQEHGVACMLKTGCSVCGQDKFIDSFSLRVNCECDSFKEEACMETCQCGLDLDADRHLIDSCVNQTNSSLASTTECEIYEQNIVQNLEHHRTVPSDIHDKLVSSISSSVTVCDKEVDCNPTLQLQNSISQYFRAGDSVTLPYSEKCDEVLHHLELIVQNLEVAAGDVAVDHEMVSDVDFQKLCQEAQNLAEETSQKCSAQVNTKVKKARSITLSSDLSDDVFISCPSSEEHNVMHPLPQEVHRHNSLDINSIFDDGTKPPVPPARTKRRKEKSKTFHVNEGIIINETKDSATALHCDTSDKSASELNVTKLSVRDAGCENSLLDCQELLIMKRVTERTKEKRSVKVTSHSEDRNLCHQEYQTHQCVSDCDSLNVTAVSDDRSNPSVSGKGSESLLPADSVIGKLGGDCRGFLNIVLTQTRPISSVEFPPSQEEVQIVSSSCDARMQSDVETVEASCDESGILLQNRKGSTSSDITAWKQELQHSGLCYLDDEWDAECMLQPEKWFSSNDAEGKVYFFEENSNQSSWTLPDFGNAGSDNPAHSASRNPSELERQTKKDEHCHDTDVHLRSGQQVCQPEIRAQQRMTKAHSMVLANSRKKQTSSKSSSFPRNWPQLWDGNMCVLKEGTLNRTKITENGKKLRKNWAPAHVVLTELFLLFFKDAKTFEAMKNSNEENASGAAQPEFSIDLNGALLEHGEKVSSRRNVFLLTTVLGLQVLLQCENAQQEEEWYKAIFKAIKDLPYAYDVSPRNKASKLNPVHISSGSPEEIKKSSVIGRSRSMKMKLTSKDESQEDLTAGSEENQTKIRNRLKKFFHRRPTKESLVKKGIYKDEPVFGRNLQDVCKGESPRVPVFVRRCIAAIECKEENMKTDGLYRASGNLSQVQKIRLQVDQNNLDVLDQEEDVHVLTGALKLFFRELKKPLIPFEHFSKALRASTNPSKKEKLQHFKEIVKALPLQNRDTLEFLFRHLLRVTAYKEFNRMHIPNLAIVFGPTLMWPEAESLNMALDLMQQNLVIEYLLQEFDSLFH